MTIALLAIIGPCVAAGLILLARRSVAPLAVVGVAVSLVSAVITLVRVNDGARFSATAPGLPGMPLHLAVDPLAAVLAVTVTVVATLVMIYAAGYMREDPGQPRFFAGMSFFVGSMQLLVLAGDWVLFLVAWEMIALASYLLIGFWYERSGVREAATRAFLTTRAADVGLYIGVFILIDRTGTSEIAASLGVEGGAATAAGLLLLLAAIGKSAQVPLHGWLQDAMAGPTPVSALLHSATLVVAGVILLTRAFPLIPADVRLVVGLVGGLTAIVAGIMAATQRDFKRMLASSTSSQLGYMLLALGAGSAGAAIFHLVTNAAIKSGLFLGAGIFQHDRHSTNFDELAGVGRQRRRSHLAVAVAGLSLAGIPPLAAFWSKDAVIAATLDAPFAWLLTSFALTGALLTGLYMARALRILWGTGGEPEGSSVAGLGLMGTGLAVLALLAVLLGFVAKPLANLLGMHIPENITGLVAGLIAAVVGLLGGWMRVDLWWPRSRQIAARNGFRLNSDYTGLMVRASLRLARFWDRLDRAIHSGVLAAGRGTLGFATTWNRLDLFVHRGVLAVGTQSMAIAHASRITDEVGIDGLILQIVRSASRLGGRARRLQSGLIHREMLLAAGATALVIVVLFT